MSAVPVALDALVALFAATGRVQVIDGPPTVDVAGDVIAVGLAPQEAADVQASESTVGLRAVLEEFDVLCMARSWSGNDGVKPQRDRTYRLLDAAQAAVDADNTLAGVVHDARLVGSSYMPWRTENNQLVVDVAFRVRVKAYRR